MVGVAIVPAGHLWARATFNRDPVCHVYAGIHRGRR